MHTSESWLDLLIRDASADELNGFGADLAERGVGSREDIATALRIKSLLQQRAQRAVELAALNDIAERLSALTAPAEVLPEVVEQARRLLGADIAYLGLVEDGGGDGAEPAMRIEVASGTLTSELLKITVPLTTGVAGQVITDGRPRWVSDYATDTTFRHAPDADAATRVEGLRGLLGVPLSVRGRVIGALFAAKRTERQFSDDEVTLLSGLAAHAAIAIDNARSIERLATARDELADRTAQLERTLAWDQQLTQVVLRGGGPEDLVAEVTRSATADVRLVRDDAVDALPIELGDLPGDTPVGVQSDTHLLLRRVAAGDHTFGVLVMSGTTPPGREDALLLDRAAPALALAFVAEEAVAEAGRHARDSLLTELLTTRIPDPARARRGARLAGLRPDRRYVVAVAEPSHDLDATRAQLAGRAWPPGTVLAVCQGRVVILAPVADPAELDPVWPAGEFAPTVGIAGPVDPTRDLVTGHGEATDTVQALLALGVTGIARTAEQLGIYRVILRHTGREQLDAAFHRMLRPVIEEENRRRVPLLETIERFVAERQRPRAAAAALGIHVNTLYQRLGVVDVLLGEHWREPDRALEIQLLFRLMRGVSALATRDLPRRAGRDG